MRGYKEYVKYLPREDKLRAIKKTEPVKLSLANRKNLGVPIWCSTCGRRLRTTKSVRSGKCLFCLKN